MRDKSFLTPSWVTLSNSATFARVPIKLAISLRCCAQLSSKGLQTVAPSQPTNLPAIISVGRLLYSLLLASRISATYLGLLRTIKRFPKTLTCTISPNDNCDQVSGSEEGERQTKYFGPLQKRSVCLGFRHVSKISDKQ